MRGVVRQGVGVKLASGRLSLAGPTRGLDSPARPGSAIYGACDLYVFRLMNVFFFFFNSHIFIPVPRIITPRGKGSTLRYEPYGRMPVYRPRAYERTLGGGI